METLALTGLSLGPAQLLGSLRLVPILRPQGPDDLRLFKQNYDATITAVSLDRQGMVYYSYIPYGLILSWEPDGTPIVANDTQLFKSEGKQRKVGSCLVQGLERMAKKTGKNQLRFLPLHLSMEWFLGMFFGGPTIAWKDYSKFAFSYGLGCRSELVYSGHAVQGLEEALRVFEIHDRQVGCLLFVADALASAFVVPTPGDYRALHYSLIEDFYGDLIAQYSGRFDQTFLPRTLSLDEGTIAGINSLDELGVAIGQLRQDWAEVHAYLAAGIVDREIRTTSVYSNAKFTMERFITDLDVKSENYIGERILRSNGDLEYLKLYRLSGSQTRRTYLLDRLSHYEWSLDETARGLGCDRVELIRRLERAGWGYLLNNSIRDLKR
jgi:hypothetical protein